jgi:hypothetical protein
MFNFEQKHFFSFDELIKDESKDRKTWLGGEWENEPDFFNFHYMGYYCFARRNDLGVWDGYITLHTNSRYEHETERNKLRTHGLLFYDVGETNKTIGFSCCRPHYDLVPIATGMVNNIYKSFNGDDAKTVGRQIDNALKSARLQLTNGEEFPLDVLITGTYKNVAFVVKELKALVDQLV